MRHEKKRQTRQNFLVRYKKIPAYNMEWSVDGRVGLVGRPPYILQRSHAVTSSTSEWYTKQGRSIDSSII